MAVPQPRAPDVTLADIRRQVWMDAYGKEVQSAATYSYTWMADQVGHMGVGMLLAFALIALFQHLPVLFGWHWSTLMWPELLGLAASAALVALWEYNAYSSDVKRAHGSQFPLQVGLLRRNAVIATFYMALGAAMGWALHQDWYYSTPLILGMIVLGAWLAIPWVRQKIIWQKASLPYLSRLADIKPNMPKKDAEKLWAGICDAYPPAGPPRVVVLGGKVGSGRTEFACSIGTEVAFRGGMARYMPFTKLIELARIQDYQLKPPPPGPANIGWWPWGEAQLLIIDDIGPLLEATGISEEGSPSDQLEGLLERWLDPIRPALSARSTVWILGEDGWGSKEHLEEAAKAIADFLQLKDPLAILLGHEPSQTVDRMPA
ncbi:hypothetical protein [Sandaracinobacteroides hominis]|uniref:hypothetical protein n=1 Tax=Sandaracinobacteroides hominis TaxID=2780086 RepID=UPI0018F7A4A0|nr:hypothetical protein [Sandaracinobacteroides hominis]